MENYYKTKDALNFAVTTGTDHRAANVAHYLARKELTAQQAAKVIYDALAGVGIERAKLSDEMAATLDVIMDDLSDIAHAHN